MNERISFGAMARLAPGLLLSIGLVGSCSNEKPKAVNKPPSPIATGTTPTPVVEGGAPAVDPPPGTVLDRAPSCKDPTAAIEGGAFDVEVAVRPRLGPKGRAAPVPINRRLYGMSIADWEPDDYVPAPRPSFATLLASLKPGVLRWPAGHRSQEYVWERGGAGQRGDWVLTPDHVDAFIALARAAQAEPLIAINVKRGTEAAAMDLLRYMNVEKGYGVKWLQLGNEPDLTDNMTASPSVHADEVIRFADALRSVDPTVRIVGPELLTGAAIGGIHDTVDWMTPVLAQTAGRIDGLSWHYYPLDSAQPDPRSSAIVTVEHLFQESAPDWRPSSLAYVDEVMPALDTLRAAYAPNAEVWITEMAEDPGPDAGAGISDTLAGALWVGDVLGRYGEYGPGAVLRWLFKGSSSHAYALLDPFDVPRPAYGAYWLYARHFGDRFVGATTSKLNEVAVYASLRPDSIAVVFVNKTPSARRVRVTFDGFAACAAEQLTLTGSGYGSTTFAINGTALTAATADTGIAPAKVARERLLDVELPPASMQLTLYRP